MKRSSPSNLRPSRLRSPILLALLLAVAVTTGGCAFDRPWTFGATRWSFREDVYRSSGGSSEFLLVALGVFVALDVLFLPMAVFHDIWWSHHDAPAGPEMPNGGP